MTNINQNINFLIVDDNPFNIFGLKDMLEENGWKNVFVAFNGEQAV